jgi:hypothetical protein
MGACSTSAAAQVKSDSLDRRRSPVCPPILMGAWSKVGVLLHEVKVKFIASSGGGGRRGREVRRRRGEACLARRCPGRPGRPRGIVPSGKSKVHCIIGGVAGCGRAFDALKNLLRPAGAKKEQRRKESSLSSAFHGLARRAAGRPRRSRPPSGHPGTGTARAVAGGTPLARPAAAVEPRQARPCQGAVAGCRARAATFRRPVGAETANGTAKNRTRNSE